MTTKEKIEVMQAHVDGREVEGSGIIDSEENYWVDTINPSWNWHKYNYRIKTDYIQITTAQAIADQFKDKEVVMLHWMGNFPTKELRWKGAMHINAQSMEEFAGYVYTNAVGFVTNLTPTIWSTSPAKVEHPVAVLFSV